MTHFISKETIIEAEWLNRVDATVLEALQSATTASGVRLVLNVPEDTSSPSPQVRVQGAWQALSASTAPLHKATHSQGGSDEINHNDLLNSAGDTHIDHSTVSILNGDSISGGGDLTGDRTISFTHILAKNIDAGGFRITNMADSVNSQDAVTNYELNQALITAGANPWVEGLPAATGALYYNAGLVGIGTDTPTKKLDVRGDVNLSQAVAVGGLLTATGGITSAGAVAINNALNMNGWIQFVTLRGVRSDSDIGSLLIAGSNDNANGAQITLYGKTHAQYASIMVHRGKQIDLRTGSDPATASNTLQLKTDRSAEFFGAVKIAGTAEITNMIGNTTLDGTFTVNEKITGLNNLDITGDITLTAA